MTLFQRFALWLIAKAGLLPRVTPQMVDEAKRHVQRNQAYMKFESSEYRRHVALKELTNAGASSRQAAIAIEVAVHLTK